ncbi:EamA domain, WAT1-related protein, partial [Tanacetum coccineum]
MTSTRSETWSWSDDVLPFVAMLMLTCMNIGLLTIVKAVMNDETLNVLPSLPVFFSDSSFLAFRVCMFEGVYYSSPTMGSAIGNLGPANTFFLAIIFRMEKLEIKSSSSQAKLLGTITAISGAMVITFYQGPGILKTIISPDSSNYLLLSQLDYWRQQQLESIRINRLSSFLMLFYDDTVYSSISFPRTKSKCLGAATQDWDDCCCFGGGIYHPTKCNGLHLVLGEERKVNPESVSLDYQHSMKVLVSGRTRSKIYQ